MFLSFLHCVIWALNSQLIKGWTIFKTGRKRKAKLSEQLFDGKYDAVNGKKSPILR